MGRSTLKWFNVSQKPSQDLCLKIPNCDVYSGIIDRAFPDLDHIGWRDDTWGTCYTFIKNIDDNEVERLRGFLELLQRIWCLTITEHLAPFFATELDEAYALDFNFKQDTLPLAYTQIGFFEHLAKEEQNRQAINELANRLAEVITNHPTLARADQIVALPPRPSKQFHLPVELVNEIGRILGRPVGLELIKDEHPKLRGLAMVKKLATLEGVFHLSESINGQTVLMVDDLYQSGTTAWSLAKFLKENGAREVYALACVKSWRDTDNQ
jgi:predicted amidophosphoribosyltransferase